MLTTVCPPLLFLNADGLKIILKAMGKDPFPQGRQSVATDVAAPESDIDACRWGYQCSVCLLAGDLLCCEHPDGCAVSVHPQCTGQPFPTGPWICSNHDDRRLKTRVRRRGSKALDFDDGASEETISDEEETRSLADSEATEDYDGVTGPRKGKKRGGR